MSKNVLFIKPGCHLCKDAKDILIDSGWKDRDKISFLDVTSAEGLRDLVWRELKAQAELSLPILCVNDTVLYGVGLVLMLEEVMEESKLGIECDDGSCKL